MKAWFMHASTTKRFVFYAGLMVGGVFSGLGNIWVETAEAADKKYIVDDSTGGGCSQIGIWDHATRKCTLTSDLTDVQIYINSNNITLDGNGRTLTFSKESVTGDDAVTIDSKTGVTIKNFIFREYHYGINLHYADSNTVSNIVAINSESAGISLSGANNNTLTNNNISNKNSDTGICIGFASSNNYIAGNTVTNIERGIFLHDLSNGNTITGNTLTNDVSAITLYDSDSNNVITDNIISTNVTLPAPLHPSIAAAVYLHRSSQNNIVAGNTISGMNNGLYFSDGASMNHVYHNNFMGNGNFQVDASGGFNNEFSQNPAGGGNYWKVHDTPDEGCSDVNTDGFCDAPFVFPGGQDNLPFTSQNGWTCTAPALSLSMTAVYWPNFADYKNRKLSIDWRITNSGRSLAKNVRLTAISYSKSIVNATSLPYSVGNIAANGGSATATVKAVVPAGVNSFRGQVYVEAQDVCDTHYYYPSLPPGVLIPAR